MKDTVKICEEILENNCKECVYRKNNKNDCPFHKNIVKPIAVYGQKPDSYQKECLKLFVEEDHHTGYAYCNHQSTGERHE